MFQRSAHSVVVQGLREIQDKSSRFKLRKEVQGISSLYISVYLAHGPSSVLSEKTKTDISGKVVSVIEEGKGCVTGYT